MAKQNWLKNSGMEKPYLLHRRLGCTIPFFLGLAVSIIPAVLGYRFWIPLVFIVIFAISNYLAKLIFENKIYCPKCGFNPTRRKSDGKPRLDRSKLLSQLERFEDCPNCGTSPEASETKKG